MPAIDFEIFSENLITLRKSVDLTAVELSVALNLRQQKRVADIEGGRGRPTLDEINAACTYFGVSIDDMMKKRAQVKIEFV